MAPAGWSRDMSVGVASLDAQHQRLFQMFDDLEQAMDDGRGQEAVVGIFEGLVAYAREHFEREEKLFSHTGYQEAAAHKVEHDAFIRAVEELRAEHRGGDAGAPSRALDFMSAWMRDHICGTDKRYTAHLNSRGIK